jgi:bifunctional DNA-binding transcriptional regulator/antitoxin component of YhaV-PrlF toxin-antitoxin module
VPVIQKHKAYVYKTEGGKSIEHYKHTIVIPEDIMGELGWKAGMDLEAEVKGPILMLRTMKNSEDEFEERKEPGLLSSLKRINEEKSRAKRSGK